MDDDRNQGDDIEGAVPPSSSATEPEPSEDPEEWIEPAEPPEPLESQPPTVEDQAAREATLETPDQVEPIIEPIVEQEPITQTDEVAPATDKGSRPPENLWRRSPKQQVRMVIALASGKGGVGKSLISATIGIYLAQLGKEVVLVDGSLGSGTLHTFVGLEGNGNPSLQTFINREVSQLADVILPTRFPGLGLISAMDDGVGAANPRPAQKNRLLSQLRSLPADYVILDLGPGSGFNVLDMLLAADLQVVVFAPEPTSIEAGFRLIKCAFLRKIRSLDGVQGLVDQQAPAPHCGIITPHQLHKLAEEDSQLQRSIHEAMREFKPRIIINKCRAREDLEMGPTLAMIGRRHLGLPIHYIGYVDHDDAVWVTVRRRRPLQVEFPDAKVCKDIDRISRRLLSLETKEEPACVDVPSTIEALTHYEILGIHPGATEEEIRRAHRRVERLYTPQSNVVYNVAPPDEVASMHDRIELSYATLVDPEKRRLYDQSIFPETERRYQEVVPVEEEELAAAAEEMPPPRPDMPPIDEQTLFSGTLLRQVREARGVDLQDLADQTKISIAHLRAIEEENFTNTPAPVYIRGFLKAIAKILHLDADQVAQSYMERYS